jgi:hypothetical protein
LRSTGVLDVLFKYASGRRPRAHLVALLDVFAALSARLATVVVRKAG